MTDYVAEDPAYAATRRELAGRLAQSLREAGDAALLFIGIGGEITLGQPESLTMEDFRPHGSNWRTASEAAMSPRYPKLLELVPGSGLLVNDEADKTANLLTAGEIGDVEVYRELMIPQDSNSGMYLQGRYEVQIRDGHRIDAP